MYYAIVAAVSIHQSLKLSYAALTGAVYVLFHICEIYFIVLGSSLSMKKAHKTGIILHKCSEIEVDIRLERSVCYIFKALQLFYI